MQMCIGFAFSLRGFDTLKYLLKSASRVGSISDERTSCWSLLRDCKTKDGSSLSITRRSEFIAGIGLNFMGALGAGKNARSVSSRSRVTRIFSLNGGGALEGGVRTCSVTREGAAASGTAMVERGGSVIDPRRLS